MKTINLNTFAEKITKLEGKKKNLSIAQVKEVLKVVLKELSLLSVTELVALLKRSK